VFSRTDNAITFTLSAKEWTAARELFRRAWGDCGWAACVARVAGPIRSAMSRCESAALEDEREPPAAPYGSTCLERAGAGRSGSAHPKRWR
jgi:hypothetical protein